MKGKRFFIATILVLTMIVSVLLYMKGVKNGTKSLEPKGKQVKGNVQDLSIASQIPKDKVLVARAKLNKSGFLVVREIQEDQLSQVVEISSPLKAGVYTNVTIPLGGADIRGKSLIVMMYDDEGNDGIFNDFDMPSLNENGYMTAAYVRTGKPLSTSITEGEDMHSMHMTMPGMKHMTRIQYTDTGFSPIKVEVPVGSMVEFVNKSSGDMWVASDPHPQHTTLPTLDQFKPYKQNSTYRYVFTKKGPWGYHDHLNAQRNGMIVVK